MKHAGIIPLIGGEILASDEAYGQKPEYLMTYGGFEGNEKHLLNYYKEHDHNIPYHVIDGENAPKRYKKVDVVSSVCPCAGLSSYHNSYGEQNPNNQWLVKSTKFVLNEIAPKVLWGENAPALATNVGAFMKKKLMEIGQEAGYNMSIYTTKTLLHGNPQVRRRSFYFFWKKDVFKNKVPVFEYFDKEMPTITDLLLETKSNFQTETINKRIPSQDDPYYKYLLEEIKGGMTHSDFAAELREDETFARASYNVESEIIHHHGKNYAEVSEYMRGLGLDREADKCMRRYEKLKAGGGVMWRGTVIPIRYIGAFVVHMPHVLTHPVEDRYINIREAMNIMGLPEDYELLEPEKSINHICQNVPYKTARDMATQVKKAIEKKLPMEDATFIYQDNLSQRIRDSHSSVDITEFMT